MNRTPLRQIPLMIPMAVAGLFFTGLVATPAQAEEVWKSNDFEGGEAWFTGGKGAELTTDEAYSGDHSLALPGNDGFHIYQLQAKLPPLKADEKFGSFVFHLWIFVFANNRTSQTLQQGVRFSKPDNSDESDWASSDYQGIAAGWRELTFNFAGAANAAVAAGRTKISRAYIRAFVPKKGSDNTYKTYYVDDVSFTYTIVPKTSDEKTQ